MKHPDPVSPFLQNDSAVFHEAWHAQVLAVADGLVQSGLFSSNQWSNALGQQRAQAKAQQKPDTAQTYYHCALAALETLLAENSAVDQSAINTRSAAWARAYQATPHGKPVLLSAGE